MTEDPKRDNPKRDNPKRDDPKRDDPKVSARDLVRKRRGVYTAPETGRHHHLGSAPEKMPLHDSTRPDDGARYTETTVVQLASRTVPQLQAQRAQLAADMEQASAALDFERAAAVRDDLARVDAELTRRC